MPGCWEGVRATAPEPGSAGSIGRPTRLRQRDTVRSISALLLAVLVLGALLTGASVAQAQDVASATQSARPCVSAADPGRPRLLVDVTGARSTEGNITFTLYGDDPSRFLAHHGSIAIERVALTGRSAQGCFVVSRPGTYAVAVYHDENNNHHFDRSLIGLPEEGYGFSRNAAIVLAPPSFGSVRFTAGPGDTELPVALRY